MVKSKTDFRLTFMQNFLSSGVAGITSRTLTAPLDVVKIRTQVGTPDTSQNFVKCFQTLYRTEGLRAFWKGNLVGCLRMIPYSTIQLATFQCLKLQLSNDCGRLTPWSAAVAGAGGGMVATTLMYPTDTIKTRLIIQSCKTNSAYYSGIIDATKYMFMMEGHKTFWKGLTTTYIGVIPFSGGTFMAYEVLGTIQRKQRIHETPVVSFVKGCLAAMVAQFVSFPFDTIRKKMQAWSPTLPGNGGVSHKCSTLKQTFYSTIEYHGYMGFWNGYKASCIKVVPYAGLMFLFYESSKNGCLYYNGYTQTPLQDVPHPHVDQVFTPEEVKESIDYNLPGAVAVWDEEDDI